MGVDHSSRIPVGEHYIRTEFLIQSVLLEIHQEDAVYGTQSITGAIRDTTFTYHAVRILLDGYLYCIGRRKLGQPAYGTAYIIQCTVQKMAVPTILHLYNDILATVRTTIEVINDAFVMHIVRMVFLVKETKILYMMFARKQLIQQGDEQPFTGRLPEDDLKPQVGKGIDIFIFYLKSKVLILSGTPKRYVLYFSDIAIPADIQNLTTFLSYSPFTHNKC